MEDGLRKHKEFYKIRKLSSYSGNAYKGLTIPQNLIPKGVVKCSFEPIENGLIVRFSGLDLIKFNESKLKDKPPLLIGID